MSVLPSTSTTMVFCGVETLASRTFVISIGDGGTESDGSSLKLLHREFAGGELQLLTSSGRSHSPEPYCVSETDLWVVTFDIAYFDGRYEDSTDMTDALYEVNPEWTLAHDADVQRRRAENRSK